MRYFFFSSGPRPFINFLEFCATYSVGILVCLIVPNFAFPVDQILFVYFFKSLRTNSVACQTVIGLLLGLIIVCVRVRVCVNEQTTAGQTGR